MDSCALSFKLGKIPFIQKEALLNEGLQRLALIEVALIRWLSALPPHTLTICYANQSLSLQLSFKTLQMFLHLIVDIIYIAFGLHCI